jgi:hypothetical protein
MRRGELVVSEDTNSPHHDVSNRPGRVAAILTAKSERYRDEQETRYIIMGACALFDGIRKQRNGRNYVETPPPLSDPGNITEIIVGPGAPRDAEALVTGLLNKYGYPPWISVFRSGC